MLLLLFLLLLAHLNHYIHGRALFLFFFSSMFYMMLRLAVLRRITVLYIEKNLMSLFKIFWKNHMILFSLRLLFSLLDV